nr:DUF397 domain-containing protein [Streptomonospora nanhaiensis]
MVIADERWRTSSYSTAKGECVEIAATSTRGVAVRDTKNRDAGHLSMPAGEWAAFLTAVKAAEL